MRASGILMPISSIPSKYGIGCFSREAYDFVDLLFEAGQQYWQILPLGPTSYGDSPYQSYSTFAGNPYFIDLEELIREGLLTKEECEACDWGDHPGYVDYGKIYQSRFRLLHLAHERRDWEKEPAYVKFVEENREWLENYCLYMAIKHSQGDKSWSEWPAPLKERRPDAVKNAGELYRKEMDFFRFLQYCFFKQWTRLKAYANEKGIRIIGDVPIYVAFDSADTWGSPELFQFREDHTPKAVAGCPPDAFSATGQLWGNPLYDWEYHKKTGYAWWISRLEHSRNLYDVVRIDHFRGFHEYYAIPYGDETAENGKWEPGPGLELFDVLKANVENLNVIAEDLGLLNDEVRQMLKDSGFPGMKVLQFAFDETESSDYLPYQYEKNCVVYTGTHDNETTKGWLENVKGHERAFVREYINCYESPVNDCVWALIRAALASPADLAVIPIQDYLCLGNEARMNAPSTLGDNWKWRLQKDQISPITVYHIREVTRIYGRLPRAVPGKLEEELAEELAEKLEEELKKELAEELAEEERKASGERA